MKKFLTVMLSLIACLSCLAYTACGASEPDNGGNTPSGGDQEPPVVSYYDNALTDGVGGVIFDGGFTDMRYRDVNHFEKTVDGITVKMRSANVTTGYVFGVEITGANAYLNEDALEKSAKIILEVNAPSKVDNADGLTVEILVDGRIRIEKNDTKLASEKHRSFVKNANGKLSYEFLLPTELVSFGDSALAVDLFCVSPSDSSCQSAKTVNFAMNENYEKDKPYTWNCFAKSVGYHDVISASTGDIIYNSYDGDLTLSNGNLVYAGTNTKKFLVKDFSDSENKTSLTLSSKEGATTYSAGISYEGLGSFGIKLTSNGYVFDGFGDQKALTSEQTQALLGDGLTIYLAYANGTIYALADSEGVSAVVATKVSNGTIKNIYVYVGAPCVIKDFATGANSVKVVKNSDLVTITCAGSVFGGSLTVTVTIDKDAIIKNFVLNGEKVTVGSVKTLTKTYQNYNSMTITFEASIEVCSPTLIVKTTVGAYEGDVVPAGTEVVISGAGEIFNEATDSEGKIYLTDVPCATYTVSMEGHMDTTVTVKNDGVYTAVLQYDLFEDDTSKSFKVSADQTKINNTGSGNRYLQFNKVAENFVVEMTMYSSNPAGVPLGSLIVGDYNTNTGLWFYYGDTFFTANLLVWGDNGGGTGFQVKSQTGLSGHGDLTAEDFDDYNSNVGVRIAIVKMGRNVITYVVRDGVYHALYSLVSPSDITKICFSYWDNPYAQIKDFCYFESGVKNFANNVTIQKSDLDNTVHGSVTVKRQSIIDKLEVTFTPDEGYGIAYFAVNGMPYTGAISDNKFTLEIFNEVIGEIVVKFEKLSTLNISVYDDFGNALKSTLVNMYNTKDSDVLYTFITSETDGTYVLTKPLLMGTYVVDVYGQGEYSIVIDKELLEDGTLVLNPPTNGYKVGDGWAMRDDGSFEYNKISGVTNYTFISTKNLTYAEMVVYNPFNVIGQPSKETSGHVFLIANSANKVNTTFGLVYNASYMDFRFRFTNNEFGWNQIQLTASQRELLNNGGLKIAVLVTEQYVYGYADNGTGELALVRRTTNPTGEKHVDFITGVKTDLNYGEFSNIKALEYKTIGYQVEQTVNGDIDVVKASFGEVKANLIPANGYTVSAVTVNGVDVTNYLDGNVLTYPCTLENATISATFEKAYTISGKLTGDNGNNTFAVYKDTLICLTGNGKVYETRVGDNGSYTFSGIKAGSYTLSHGKVTFAIQVTGDILGANYTIAYTIENDHYALTYVEQLPDGYDNTKYYDNLTEQPSVPDPAVIKITDTSSEFYGYYFLYGTTGGGGFATYKSKDMINWEYVSLAFKIENGWEKGELWAPEVIYDADVSRAKYGLGEGKGVYYFFYSAGTNVNGLGYACQLGLGISNSPAGPFVRYVGYDSLGRYIDRNTPWMDGKRVNDIIQSRYGVYGGHNIDPTPFIDPETGDRYLFMTAVKGCKMLNGDWTQIDYNSFTQVMSLENVSTEPGASAYKTTTNEGPQVVYRDGKYHLSISVNGYQQKSYSVIQLVADNPLGPYRKLSSAEGGVLLSAVYGDSSSHVNGTEGNVIDNLSGPGHHYIIEVDGEYFIVYHRHKYYQDVDGQDYYYPISSADGYKPRYVTVDRIEWVKNANGLEVMRLVGPTSSVQSKFYGFDGMIYDNIAGDATISVSTGSNAKYLNDGLVLAYEQDARYFGEFSANGTVTITLTFDTYRAVSGLVIYNSKYYDSMFKKIDNVELSCVKDGVIGTAYANNISYSTDYYDTVKKLSYPGGTSVIDFEETLVKEIKITVSVASGNTKVNLSEIFVLGIPD